MKKLSTVMAIVLLFVSCLCFTASAETGTGTQTNAVKITASSGDVQTGGELMLAVEFSENTGFNTLGVKLTYPEGFTYVEDSVAASDLIKEKCFLNFAGYEGETYTFNVDTAARTITFIGASLYDIEATSGVLFTAKFTAPDAAVSAQAFEVELLEGPYNANGDTVSGSTADGSVNVTTPYKLGDVTMDGKINGFDAMMILQYDVGLRTLTDQQKQLANVHTAISAVNGFDAMMILQYDVGIITW